MISLPPTLSAGPWQDLGWGKASNSKKENSSCMGKYYTHIYACICLFLFVIYIYYYICILYYLFCREDELLSFGKGINPSYSHSGGGGVGISFISDLVYDANLDESRRSKYRLAFDNMSLSPPRAPSGFDLDNGRQGVLREDLLNRKFVPNPHAKVAALLAMCKAGGKAGGKFYFFTLFLLFG